jgi:hypothetical protein
MPLAIHGSRIGSRSDKFRYCAELQDGSSKGGLVGGKVGANLHRSFRSPYMGKLLIWIAVEPQAPYWKVYRAQRVHGKEILVGLNGVYNPATIR